MTIKYSPDASDRLRKIRQEAGIKITTSITRAIRSLVDDPRKCPTVGSILDLKSPYHYLHIAHYYVFYRIDQEQIYISDIYNEREDFMWKMFGVKLRTQESIDYWGE